MFRSNLAHVFCYRASFVAINGPIWFIFGFIDPFATNDMSMLRSWSKSPGVVADEGIVFRCHSFFPVGIFECLVIRSRFNDFRCKEQYGFEVTNFLSSEHEVGVSWFGEESLGL